jgi:hypothetical protein
MCGRGRHGCSTGHRILGELDLVLKRQHDATGVCAVYSDLRVDGYDYAEGVTMRG